MAGGEWEVTSLPKLPGFYMNFKAAGLAAVQTGDRGTVVVPIKAHWGAIGKFMTIINESDILNTFGSIEDTEGSTFYTTLKMCVLGGAKKILAYRLAGDTATEASIMLQNAPAKDAQAVDKVKLTTKYKGARGNDFKVTIAPSLTVADTFDLKLYEDTALLQTFSFKTWAELIEVVNTANTYLMATKAANDTDISTADIPNMTSVAMTGGDSGLEGITAKNYLQMLDFIETESFNYLTLDGISDPAIQTSIASWVIRMRNQGKKIVAVMGGSMADDISDDAVENAIKRSAGFNHEGIINIGVGIILNDIKYSSAQVAPFIAGLIAGQKLSESTTYAATSFDDVTRRWTREEQITALTNGIFLLINDGRIVKVLEGINTLITLRQDQNNAFKKIRSIRTMDAIDSDLQQTAEDNYIGKINNTYEGQLALIDACRQYMEVCSQGGIIEAGSYYVGLNPTYHGDNATIKPEANQVFLKWSAHITDVMEQIFSDFYCE